MIGEIILILLNIIDFFFFVGFGIVVVFLGMVLIGFEIGNVLFVWIIFMFWFVLFLFMYNLNWFLCKLNFVSEDWLNWLINFLILLIFKIIFFSVLYKELYYVC